jgi:hypothetical protein
VYPAVVSAAVPYPYSYLFAKELTLLGLSRGLPDPPASHAVRVGRRGSLRAHNDLRNGRVGREPATAAGEVSQSSAPSHPSQRFIAHLLFCCTQLFLGYHYETPEYFPLLAEKPFLDALDGMLSYKVLGE